MAGISVFYEEYCRRPLPVSLCWRCHSHHAAWSRNPARSPTAPGIRPAAWQKNFIGAEGTRRRIVCLALVTAKCPRYVRLIDRNRGADMVEVDQAFKSQNGDELLRSIQEWMVQQAHAAKPTTQAANLDESSAGKGPTLSSSIGSAEPSVDASRIAPPERPVDTTQQAHISPATSNELFVKRRLLQTIAGGFLIAFVVGVVWQAGRDNQNINLMKGWGHSAEVWLTSKVGAMQDETKTSAQSSNSDQVAQTPAATLVQTDEVAELKQQVLALANDLAVMRRDDEELSGNQEQFSRDIAAVKATEQNVSEKISSLTQPAPALPQPPPPLARPAAPARGQAQKNVPRIVHAETPKQPDAASPPATTNSSTGAGSVNEQPPRPPLPVPSVAETPSPLH
jgi:hypothetical protein